MQRIAKEAVSDSRLDSVEDAMGIGVREQSEYCAGRRMNSNRRRGA